LQPLGSLGFLVFLLFNFIEVGSGFTSGSSGLALIINSASLSNANYTLSLVKALVSKKGIVFPYYALASYYPSSNVTSLSSFKSDLFPTNTITTFAGA